MNDNNDLFSRLGDSQGNLSALGEGDPFDNSGRDLFDKFMGDDFDRSNRSGTFAESQLMLSANDGQFQEMLNSALDKEADLLLEGGANADATINTSSSNSNSNINNNHPNHNLNYGFASQPQTQFINPILAPSMATSNSGSNDWFGNSRLPIQPTPMGDLLNAPPLNISLPRNVTSMDNSNSGISTSLASTTSINSMTSLSRRKGSSAQLHQWKMGSARKVGLTSSKLKSTKSEGMLARALKARYNSGNSLNKYNINAAEASAMVNGRVSRIRRPSTGGESLSGLAQRMSQSNMIGEKDETIPNIQGRTVDGGRNATWGQTQTKKPGASLFANIISSPGGSRRDVQSVTSTSSMASLMRQQKAAGHGSRTSMQDLLRLSKKQSKTQSALRQSSAQSLLKQSSSQSLRGPNQKVDLSNLMPPEHAMTGLNTSGSTPSPKINTGRSKQAQSGMMPANNIDGASLLHQSCRLYPTTAPVVESALRIDPDSVRKALPITHKSGQVKKNYGYPVNLALTHGGSLEVIQMLIQAGPDVLVQRDGTDGSGSLGIALANKVDAQVIDIMIQANAECVQVADRRGNYPLHVAVSSGLPFQLVKRLHLIYPKALQMQNFHSQTPLDIAQRSTRCTEEVMNYLQNSAFSSIESNARHMDQHNQADLEDGLDDIMETNF